MTQFTTNVIDRFADELKRSLGGRYGQVLGDIKSFQNRRNSFEGMEAIEALAEKMANEVVIPGQDKEDATPEEKALVAAQRETLRKVYAEGITEGHTSACEFVSFLLSQYEDRL